jgi:hypothetical protein
MLGLFLSVFLIVVYLSSLTSFGIPFMAPLSPIRFKDALYAIVSLPWKMYKRRSNIYEAKDPTRQGENT